MNHYIVGDEGTEGVEEDLIVERRSTSFIIDFMFCLPLIIWRPLSVDPIHIITDTIQHTTMKVEIDSQKT